MRVLICDNGVIINTIVVDDTDIIEQLYPECTWADIENRQASIGDLYDPETDTITPAPPEDDEEGGDDSE